MRKIFADSFSHVKEYGSKTFFVPPPARQHFTEKNRAPLRDAGTMYTKRCLQKGVELRLIMFSIYWMIEANVLFLKLDNCISCVF